VLLRLRFVALVALNGEVVVVDVLLQVQFPAVTFPVAFVTYVSRLLRSDSNNWSDTFSWPNARLRKETTMKTIAVAIWDEGQGFRV